jgi:hypothetical protein
MHFIEELESLIADKKLGRAVTLLCFTIISLSESILSYLGYVIEIKMYVEIISHLILGLLMGFVVILYAKTSVRLRENALLMKGSDLLMRTKHSYIDQKLLLLNANIMESGGKSSDVLWGGGIGDFEWVVDRILKENPSKYNKAEVVQLLKPFYDEKVIGLYKEQHNIK